MRQARDHLSLRLKMRKRGIDLSVKAGQTGTKKTSLCLSRWQSSLDVVLHFLSRVTAKAFLIKQLRTLVLTVRLFGRTTRRLKTGKSTLKGSKKAKWKSSVGIK